MNEWMRVIPTTQKITKNSRICSQHFDKECIEQKPTKRYLKTNCIPSKFPKGKNNVKVSEFAL